MAPVTKDIPIPTNYALVACPLCGEDNCAEYCQAPSHYGPERLRVVQCRGCRMIYTNPQLVTYTTQVENLGALSRHLAEERLYSARAQARMQLRMLARFGAQGPLFDFGAGNGAFVRECLDQGYDAVGHDLNTGLVEAANRHWNFEALHSGQLDQFLSKHPGPYGAIMANQVVEHIQQPREICNYLARHLRPGGLFYIDVPYVHQPREWFQKGVTLDPTAHWNHFSIRSLKELMARIGLKPVFASASPGFVRPLVRLRLESLSVLAKRVLPPIGSGVCVIGQKI